MAQIFGLPEGFAAPEFDFRDMKKSRENEKKFLKELKAYCIKRNPTESVGEIISFPVADGKAMYMVASLIQPVQLIHLPLGDEYQFPFVKRLTARDIRQLIKADKAMAEIFGGNKE